MGKEEILATWYGVMTVLCEFERGEVFRPRRGYKVKGKEPKIKRAQESESEG